MDGIINIYKERGYTSHDVVAKMRGILRQKRIGHTGTLDPDAEGVLPVCLGKATRLCDRLEENQKVYEAVLHLGIETDTQDLSGTVLKEQPVNVSEEEVKEAVYSFLGNSMQIPPMYSAVKVGGRRLYELAREGKTVEREPRPITVFEIEIENITLPDVTMRIRCSKGTYIRTICHDIGQKLGCGGAMKQLLRTEACGFRIQDSVRLDELQKLAAEGNAEKVILPVSEILKNLPVLHCRKEQQKALMNGNILKPEWLDPCLREGKALVFSEEEQCIGIYVYIPEKAVWKPEVMLLIDAPEKAAENE